MLFGVGVSCRVLCSVACCLCVDNKGTIASVEEERASVSVIVCLWLVVSVQRGFLFLLVLEIGCVFFFFLGGGALPWDFHILFLFLYD